MTAKDNPGAKFRTLLDKPGAFLLPGVYDAWSAKIMADLGFPALYMSGSAVTASRLGQPDVGLITLAEMVDQARNIASAVNVPILSDADTGYGNAINVMRTVRMFEDAGVAGIQLEDQVFPKRCGHFEGKEVISLDEMVGKIEAAVAARRSGDFVIVARTDAIAVHGIDDAIERGRAYAAAGADVLFIEAPRTEDQLLRITESFTDIPLLYNVVEGGKSPQLSFERLEALGFKIILYPTASIRAVAKALQELGSHLQRERTTEGMLDRLITFEERNRLTGLREIEALEKRFAAPRSIAASP